MKNYKSIPLILIALAIFSCEKLEDVVGHPIEDEIVNPSELTFTKIGGFVNGSGDEGFAEISAYDAKTGKLFVVNPVEGEVSVWDINQPSVPSKQASIALSGIPNSVAVHDGLLAIAVENENKQADGTVEVYDTATMTLANSYPAGALPDMVAFSPNGRYIVAANEGEPNDDYTVDPEGSISVIDVENNEVNTLFFTNYNGQVIGNDFRVFGPNASVAQDIEPEYVAISDDSKYAYISLQENNGMAVVDLTTMTLTDVFGLGVKDHSLVENAIDASNKDDMVGNFQTWPVLGFYMPDAITYAKIGGAGYIISANEGDSRDYDGYSEEERVKDLELDATAFPNAEELQADENLGRLKTTTANGDTDGDGDFDKIYSYGARSFTIWSPQGQIVYDSGDEIGRKTLEIAPALFNNDEGEADDRSDDKGAEPESVTTLKIGESTLLFVGLERTGGAMVYDITNPSAPEFLKWIFNTQDVAPEGLLVIPADESPNGENLLVITNEVSNTVSIYEIR
ncbi:choice-of-anchor I family protein [Zobellia uliginosa]|uniref:choice-of-anchor I family protein n=1 Tax=Zobellia uliginosa TaxID=143224 RepID=UPI001C072A37|nr:choice-of-anchor I family protein [Zobellia uliginosa]MBU2947004.1 choice-of-anchor I family protein [Zobellia uliginosa]